MKLMNEDHLNENMEMGAEKYMKQYRPQMEALSHTALAKVRSLQPYDYYAVGKMLESWDEFKDMVEADGSIADLGIIPKIAYDVITIAYGTSPIGIVASIQNIEEEQGVVYYKDVATVNKLGNMNAGDHIFDTLKAPIYPIGYSGQTVEESEGLTVNAQTAYAFTLSYVPVRKYTFSTTFAIAGAPIVLTDDGAGNIIGAGGYGTIDYVHGAVAITLLSNPGVGSTITADYQCEIEAKPDVPAVQYELQSKPVFARVYALKSTFGMLKAYGLRKRFGQIAEDEAAIDLTNAINLEIFGDCTRKMLAACQGTTTWSYTSPNGVSYYEHKQTFKDALAQAEAVIVTNAGRGTLSFIVAGTEICAICQTLPGFQKVYDGNSIAGAHLFGTLDGVPIVRIPIAAQLSPVQAILGYKGVSAFEAPAVFAPYMPLTVTSVLPTPNPLVQQRAAAVWAAIDVLVQNFLTLLTVSNYTSGQVAG